jgi:hypothetical protein
MYTSTSTISYCITKLTELKQNFEDLDKTQFEKTQNMILKNILGVHSKFSNTADKCELGMVPLKFTFDT